MHARTHTHTHMHGSTGTLISPHVGVHREEDSFSKEFTIFQWWQFLFFEAEVRLLGSALEVPNNDPLACLHLQV